MSRQAVPSESPANAGGRDHRHGRSRQRWQREHQPRWPWLVERRRLVAVRRFDRRRSKRAVITGSPQSRVCLYVRSGTKPYPIQTGHGSQAPRSGTHEASRTGRQDRPKNFGGPGARSTAHDCGRRLTRTRGPSRRTEAVVHERALDRSRPLLPAKLSCRCASSGPLSRNGHRC